MPVNTAALKTFAPAMRRQLLEAVGRKLDLLLHSQTPDTLSTYAKQISELREQEAENREQLLERVAYTWFNRLCALRYLDARGWHPFGCKVLMPAAEGETQPELLKLMRAGSLPAELRPHTNEARLHGLLDGQIPPAIAGADPQGEVYRELVLASCRSYHQLLPELFEGLDDARELLLPDDLLSEGSIAGGFRSAISDADCENVEIIGWLYQFYISEKKDQVIGKVVKSEDIPAATQLFTPNWIVKYMVQNSLGATWLATYPDSSLKGQMEFYIEPAEQTPEVQAQLAAITPESLDPEVLTLIDPACGSGHILTEAYDLLKAIYLERGYRQRDIPELILTKNLYGLDICPRAAQLSAFSLLMKGREDDRRLLERGIQLNVMALQNSAGLNVERLAASLDLAAAGVNRADVRMLAELFAHATTFGSLIEVPPLLTEKLPALSRLAAGSSLDLFAASQLHQLRALIRQAEVLAGRYDSVIVNPPYMGSKGMPSKLKKYAEQAFPRSKRDLYACFIEKATCMAKPTGTVGLLTMQNWLFQTSFEDLRKFLIITKTLQSLVQIGYNSFPSLNSKVALAASFVIRPQRVRGYQSIFIDLNTGSQSADKERLFLAKDRKRQYREECNVFSTIPGHVFSYSSAKILSRAFNEFPALSDVAIARQGIATGDDETYVRLWHEVGFNEIEFHCSSKRHAWESGKKWFPLNKGGPFRKWFGNSVHVISFDANSYNELKQIGNHCPSENLYFKPATGWSDIATKAFGARYRDQGEIFATLSMSIFAEKYSIEFITAFLNSPVCKYILDLISPGLHYSVGYVASLPICAEDKEVRLLAEECIRISRDDWNSQETSSSFSCNPVLSTSGASRNATTLEASIIAAVTEGGETSKRAAAIEHEINKMLIDSFSLQEFLDPKPDESEITLTCNPSFRYSLNINDRGLQASYALDLLKELVSFSLGCMMGRYSLDQPGLILADARDSQSDQLAAYEDKVGKPLSEVQFKPDSDGIIPVLDGEWFEDDIVARTREFLAVTFPESSVAENLRFIEDSLGKDIRKYFCSEFYKDHLQTYKKRPIYWMVQSPAGPSRGGFACLIYLHRTTKDTLNQVLNNYFRPYLQKLEARLAQLGLDQLNDDLPARERTAARKEAEKITKVLKECQAWEQDALLPLAQQRIELDLDDGVKVNYLKLQDVLAPIPGLAAKED